MKAILLIMIGLSAIASDTVIDKTTGLMWQDNKEVETITKDWSGAKEYCEDLTLSNYSDWRLPNVDELLSIADITRKPLAIKKEFHYVTSNFYWSSSVSMTDSAQAWLVYFDDGGNFYFKRNRVYYVRCVRGSSRQ